MSSAEDLRKKIGKVKNLRKKLSIINEIRSQLKGVSVGSFGKASLLGLINRYKPFTTESYTADVFSSPEKIKSLKNNFESYRDELLSEIKYSPEEVYNFPTSATSATSAMSSSSAATATLPDLHTIVSACHGSFVTSNIPGTHYTGTETGIRQRIEACRLPFEEYPMLDSVVLITGFPGCTVSLTDDVIINYIFKELQDLENTNHRSYIDKISTVFPQLTVGYEGVPVAATDRGESIFGIYKNKPVFVSVINDSDYINTTIGGIKGSSLSEYCTTTGTIPPQVSKNNINGTDYMNIFNVSTYTRNYAYVAGGGKKTIPTYSLKLKVTGGQPGDGPLLSKSMGIWKVDDYITFLGKESPTYGLMPSEGVNIDEHIHDVMGIMKYSNPTSRIRIVISACGVYSSGNSEIDKILQSYAGVPLFCKDNSSTTTNRLLLTTFNHRANVNVFPNLIINRIREVIGGGRNTRKSKKRVRTKTRK